MMMLLRSFVLFNWLTLACHGFVLTTSRPVTNTIRSSALAVSGSPIPDHRRKTLLSRDGPYFQLDRVSGNIEFGATANLVTQLDVEPNEDGISTWLRDQRGMALSIWDDVKEQGNDVYRLQIMTLKFITIELSPWVDVQMKTLTAQSKTDPSRQFPIFRLQSVDFEPNLQVLPGLRVTAKSLGMVIQVVGEMRPTVDGKGVTGKISFAVSGKLPAPLSLLPESALKAATVSINKTVVDYAIRSFQKGSKANYEEFRQKQQAAVQEQEA
jgi:hypothetical protein